MPTSLNHGMPTSLPSTVLFSTIARVVLLGRVAELGCRDRPVRRASRPDHVDHHHVDVGGLALEEALILGERVGRALRTRDHGDRDARVLLESIGHGLVEVVAQPDAVTVVGDLLAGEGLGGGGVLDPLAGSRA